MATNVRKIDNLDVPFKEFMPGQIIQSGQFNDDMKDIEDKVNEIIGEQNTLVDEVNAHIDNFENPHQVTAHQTGTYTSQEIDEFVEDIKSGNLHDNAIGNRVLDDDCVSTRNILDGSVTSSKLDSSVGSQIDISTNVSIKDRYTKEETDLLIQEKVGDGTYDKATIDEKLEQIQAGQILDKSINIHQLKDDVGRRLDISNNPDILNKYTRDEVDLLIQNNALPRDWGSILEEDNDTPVIIPTKEITLPVANHMKANTFTVSESSILDIDIQENVDARGEFNTVGERLNSVDSQVKDNMNKISDDKVYVRDFEDIQLAIDYAYENNIKNVLLEGKSYEIDKPIILYEGIKLLGTSKLNTKIIKTNNSYSEVKGYNNADIDTIIHIVKKDSLPTDNVKDVVIENISLYGNTNNRNKYGIYIHNMALSNLSNLYIEGVEEGLFSFAYIWDSKLSQIRVHNAYRGFYIGSSTSLILENCYASSCKNYGFYLNNFKYSNVLSCACDLVGNSSIFEDTENNVAYAYYIKNGDGVLISGCGSEQTNGTCLKIVNSKNVSVNNMTNLFIKSNYKGLTDDYVSSYEFDNNNGVIFTNSYFSYLDNGYTGNNNYLNHLKSIVRINNNNVVINNIQIDNCNYSEFNDKLTNLIDTRSCYTGHDTVYTDRNIYVSTTGDDIVNDGSFEKPFKTINKALNSLPRFIESTVQIKILDGDYYEYPIVKNFRGSGSLKVMSHSKDKTKVRIIGQAQKPVISINSNSCNIIIDSISVFAKTSNATCVRSYLNTSMIEIRNCKLDSWGSAYTNVIAVDSNRSICDLLDTCQSTYTTTSIKSDYGSNVIKHANTLVGEEISQHGGIIR